MPAIDQVERVAAENGWTARPQLDGREYRRGRRYVWVEYSVRGTVVAATTRDKYFHGRDKLARVLAELAR